MAPTLQAQSARTTRFSSALHRLNAAVDAHRRFRFRFPFHIRIHIRIRSRPSRAVVPTGRETARTERHSRLFSLEFPLTHACALLHDAWGLRANNPSAATPTPR